MGKDSNIGIVGPNSVRLAGKKIENLPIAEAAGAKTQLPAVYEADRETKIEAIKAKYPRGSVQYYNARIRECSENIDRVNDFRKQQQAKIAEYTSQLALCDFRDKEIEKIAEDDPDRSQKIKDLKKRFPPYDTEAMKVQISQFEEACQRCDQVVKKEHESIAELREAIGLCKQRDLEIKAIGG